MFGLLLVALGGCWAHKLNDYEVWVDDPGAVPSETTHLRWRIDGGEGRLTYRALVR